MDKSVFIAGCPDYEKAHVSEAVHRALQAFGGAEAFGVKGKRVVLKINLLSANPPDHAVTTHPEVVAAIAREFIGAGGDVLIADSPIGTYTAGTLRRAYAVCGIEKAAVESGARLNEDVTFRRVRCDNGKYCKEFDVLTPVLDADLVVSVAKLKTHGLAYYTGAVKNLFGVIPGLEKAAFHSRHPNKQRFNGVLVDLCNLIKPGLSFVDGVVGMDGPGPSGGSPKFAGVIGASRNPYALDLAMCDIASLPQQYVPVLVEAAEQKLVPQKAAELDYDGDDPAQFRTRFRPAVSAGKGGGILGFAVKHLLPKAMREDAFRSFASWPVMNSSCIACGKCAEVCPRQVIRIENHRAVPDYDGCIRCYCCHEICPVKAIDLRRLSEK